MAHPFSHLTKLDLSNIATAEQLDGNVAWSSEFEWKEIQQLAFFTSAYKAKKGVVVVNEGDSERYMGIILSGALEVTKKDKKGKPKAIAQISRGRTFGEMSLIDAEPRSATLVASQESVVLMITPESVTRLSEENPRLAYKFIVKVARLLSQRLRQTSGMLADRPRNTPCAAVTSVEGIMPWSSWVSRWQWKTDSGNEGSCWVPPQVDSRFHGIGPRDRAAGTNSALGRPKSQG